MAIPTLGDFWVALCWGFFGRVVQCTEIIRYADLALRFPLNPEFGIPNLFDVLIWSSGEREGKALI